MLKETCELAPLEESRIQISKVEERAKDSWVDMSLRSLRDGEVRFYRVNDPLTGRWLFKVCSDNDMQRTIVKALKCPPGRGFAQLEGSTMLFQKSLIEGSYYDVISLSYIDENERLRRNVVATIEEVPEPIRKSYRTADYNEATGKKALGKRLVALCDEKDEKEMIILFVLQRAWPISRISPDLGSKSHDLLELIRNLERAQINDVYQAAEKEYELTKENTDTLLGLLESEGKILRSNEYIKTRR